MQRRDSSLLFFPTNTTQQQPSSSLSSLTDPTGSDATAGQTQGRGADQVAEENPERTVLHLVLDRFSKLQERVDTLEMGRDSPNPPAAAPSSSTPTSKGKEKATPLDASRPTAGVVPHATEAIRSTIPPHLLVDEEDPVDTFARMPNGDKDAFRVLLRRFGINVKTFIDIMQDRSASSSTLPAATSQPLTKAATEPIPRSSTPIPSRDTVVGSTLEPPTSDTFAASAVSQHSGRVSHCKPEYLGTFSGNPTDLEDFISQVHAVGRANPDPAWKMALLHTLPLVMEKDARVWHTGLSDTEAAEMTTLTAWFDRMREAFPVNPYEQRNQARTRAWVPMDESASAYYFYKLRLLRSAYGKDHSEKNLAIDILDGLPVTFRVMLRLPRQGVTLQDIRQEISDREPMFRELQLSAPTPPATAIPLPPRPVAPPVSSTPRPAAVNNSSSSTRPGPSAPSNSRSGPSSGSNTYVPVTPETYDPTCAIPASGTTRRKYRRPDNGRTLTLNRPCAVCNKDHFDFEHPYMVAKGFVLDPLEPYPEEDPDDEGFETSATTEN
ncbi:hypothetical protein A4X06_0g5083 [Tilletia controversa]|uniref:Uncharacterized protein n=1 Tax=Tilletia controversa TaxID=13291 RepID=A0A8X7MSN7_9BASI|nr:hypothetical protein CF328_g7841 [Tilletia controversa]KAE8246268.1 hypothetical protein A4X06_0g5083 [Tilletia controversa]